MHDRLSALARPDDRVVRVKRGHDIQPIFRKAAVAEQRPPQLAGADQDRVVRIAVAEEALDVRDQLLPVVADLGPSAVADQCKILADLHLAHVQRARQRRRGDVHMFVAGNGLQIRKIRRQPFQRCPGDLFFSHMLPLFHSVYR